jgi:starch synthase
LYQGWFSWSKSNLLPFYDPWKSGLLDWNNTINPMSSAIRCAGAVTTVSWSYMYELMESANGLESLFREVAYKCHGVLNGIDIEVWNPETDTYLEHHYTEHTVNEVKNIHKQEICQLFQLNPNNPLIIFIGRLVSEKGADILPDSMARAMYETQGKVCFLVLGSGLNQIEDDLTALKNHFGGIYNCFIGYNEALSHRLYAAADFILMPSLVEPCGLNQMYALRYGTIPMVRNTGGLRDTVVDYGEYEGFGIRFNHASINDVVISTHRALQLYENEALFKFIRQRIMTFNNSWELSQERYESIYRSL